MEDSVFVIIEFVEDLSLSKGREIAAITFSKVNNPDVSVHMFSGWKEIVENDHAFVAEQIAQIKERIRRDWSSVTELARWENALRVRGPFPISEFRL